MRKSGVLLHISSLASPHGIGTLGKEAGEFIDFLAAAGQSYWQILPVCPTGYGDSPYQSFSSFAGNPYFIDLDELAEEGLLEHEEYANLDWGSDPAKVDFGKLNEHRISILQLAAERLLADEPESFRRFCSENAFWLDEYALFMSVKQSFGGISWTDWDDPYRNHDEELLARFSLEHGSAISEWKAIQYMFFRQWKTLRTYAEQKGIRIIGDMPIYVSMDSADVWAHPEMFQLDGERRPVEVSGCPPDGFSDKGQMWGNPLFDWEGMKKDGYSWWIRRIEYLTGIYHVLRIDHFRGFESYYAIPYGADDASKGCWRKGPGIDFFRTVESAIGKKDIIAEDLGFVTPDVAELLKETGYPGMKVLEMAFDKRDPQGSLYLPENYYENCVAYLGTHDNEPAIGWIMTADREDTAEAIRYLGLNDPDNYNWDMMRSIWKSDAGLTVVQAQDILGLGTESRMNTPSVPAGNWQWRSLPGSFNEELASKLADEMKACRRCK